MTNSLAGWFLIIVAIVVAFMCIAALMGPSAPVAPPDAAQSASNLWAQIKAQVSDHGLKKHVEAQDIQDSCNQNGPIQTWKDSYEKGKFYFLCKLDESKYGTNKYGIIPVIKDGATWIGKTAFSPKGGTWNEVLNYLMNTATRFNGILP